MAQPKLNAPAQPLLSIGPLDGLDATTDPFVIDGTFARDLLNFVPNHTYKALSPIAGRIGGQFAPPPTPTTLALYYPKGAPAALVACSSSGKFAYENLTNFPSSPWTNIPVPPSPSGPTISGNPGSFARYSGWMFFTNSDPNGICYKFDSKYGATFWGIEYPPAMPQTTITSPTNGQIYGGATPYYYRYTYAANRTTDPGLSQESSPSPPAGPFSIGTPLGPPTSNGATVTQAVAPSLSPNTSGGSIPDNTYTVGITWLTAAGESGISKTAQVTVSGGMGAATITITPNSPPAGATGYNVYTGTSATSLTQQGASRGGTGATTELAYTTTGTPAPPYTGFLNPPTQPVVHIVTGGSLPARTEYYQLTYVNANGETTASPETAINLQQGQLAVVVSPGAQSTATGYNVYGTTTSNQEVAQNSSPIAIGTNWNEPNSGLILGQSASLVLQSSPDPQVTTINVYRIGGQSLGNWYYVGSIANPATGTVTYVDNVPDGSVTGQALVLHRDPPAPFGATFVHAERMMGFGYPAYTDFNGVAHPARPSDLWYSNYNEAWGFDNTNQVIPVGAEDAGDIGVAGASLSGIGMLWKSKTTWALYGSTPSDFFVSKLFDIGCAAQYSAIVALGVAFWLSNQGVYMFDGATLTYLSRNVKKILDGMKESDYAAAVACFDDRMYWLSFPTVGIALGYDTVSQNWFKAGLVASAFAFDPEGASRPTAPDYVFGVNPLTGLVDQWFAATTDLGAPIISTLLTRLASAGPQIGTLRVRYIELLCSANLSTSDAVTVTVTANPATVARTFSKTFGKSTVNTRQRSSVAPGIQGDALQLQVTATTSDGALLDGAAAHGWTRRMYNVIA